MEMATLKVYSEEQVLMLLYRAYSRGGPPGYTGTEEEYKEWAKLDLETMQPINERESYGTDHPG